MSMIINNTQTEIASIEHYTVLLIWSHYILPNIDHSIIHSDIIWPGQQFKPTIKQCYKKNSTFNYMHHKYLYYFTAGAPVSRNILTHTHKFWHVVSEMWSSF